jgi:multiple sugar transport system ATP-binding protein
MKDGRIQQVGTPREVYEQPANIFVAGFIGTPPMNFIHCMFHDNGTFTTTKNKFTFRMPEAKLEIARELGYENREVVLGIRPEDIYDNQNPEMAAKWNPYSMLDITAEISELLGGETNIYTTVDGDQVVASVPCRADIAPGQPFKLWMDFDHAHLFDPDTELIINEHSQHAFVEDDDLDI